VTSRTTLDRCPPSGLYSEVTIEEDRELGRFAGEMLR